MKELQRLENNEMVVEAARNQPMLGVCLVMQVMLEWSDENGGVPALGLFPGRVSRLPDPPADGSLNRLQVPPMGWSRAPQPKPPDPRKCVPDSRAVSLRRAACRAKT